MKNLLIAKDLEPMMMSAMTFLRRSDITVHTAASTEELLKFHIEKNAHLIVTRPGLPGIACDTLFNIIRRGETMKKVSLLLLCDNTTSHQDVARRCCANAVVTPPVDTALFAAKIQQLLDVPPRRTYRVLLNITVQGKHGGRPVMCNSVNISSGGMLLRTNERLSQGDHIACSFYLPDGRRVGAQGDIVRSFQSDSGAEAVHYGIRFQTFSPGSEAAIAAFIQRDQGRQQPTDSPRVALAG
jgi:DNA-binding response OmpR family regulator